MDKELKEESGYGGESHPTDSGRNINSYISKLSSAWRAQKQMRKGWKMHRTAPTAQHGRIEYDLFDPGAPWRKRLYSPHVATGWKLRKHHRLKTLAGLGAGTALGLAGLGATVYGINKAVQARRRYQDRHYDPKELAKARWRRKVALSGGATSGAMMGLAGAAAHTLSTGGMTKTEIAKLVGKATAAGAAGGGIIGAAFSPGPPKRRHGIRTALEDLANNGKSVENVVEWLMSKEHDCEEG